VDRYWKCGSGWVYRSPATAETGRRKMGPSDMPGAFAAAGNPCSFSGLPPGGHGHGRVAARASALPDSKRFFTGARSCAPGEDSWAVARGPAPPPAAMTGGSASAHYLDGRSPAFSRPGGPPRWPRWSSASTCTELQMAVRWCRSRPRLDTTMGCRPLGRRGPPGDFLGVGMDLTLSISMSRSPGYGRARRGDLSLVRVARMPARNTRTGWPGPPRVFAGPSQRRSW
jgi:hypothetical protein